MTNEPTPHSSPLDIARAARMLRDARHVICLTGAGISVESGIPPFRGPGGIWTKHGEPPMDGYQRFLRDPAQAWRDRLNPKAPWAKALGETLAAARPNSGHCALAELERIGHCHAVITQNIDDLHGQAGHQNLLEIHGNHFLLRCTGCMTRFRQNAFQIDPNDTHDPKRSLPVWLRVEAEDVGDPLLVQVTGKVGWGNCPTGIDSCDNSCTVTATDPDDSLLNVKGKWGFLSHHYDYFVDLFRAGSEPGP